MSSSLGPGYSKDVAFRRIESSALAECDLGWCPAVSRTPDITVIIQIMEGLASELH